MDLKLLDAEPTAARARCDRPPARRRRPTRWDGGERSPGDGGPHGAHGPRCALATAPAPAGAARAAGAVGWISPGGLNYVCKRLDVPPADAYGVATFYALLAVEPRPPRVVHVCEDLACRCHGSRRADRAARGALRAGGRATSTAPPGSAARVSASAIGRPPRCSRSPAWSRASRCSRRSTTAEVLEILAGDDVTGAELP